MTDGTDENREEPRPSRNFEYNLDFTHLHSNEVRFSQPSMTENNININKRNKSITADLSVSNNFRKEIFVNHSLVSIHNSYYQLAYNIYVAWLI